MTDIEIADRMNDGVLEADSWGFDSCIVNTGNELSDAVYICWLAGSMGFTATLGSAPTSMPTDFWVVLSWR